MLRKMKWEERFSVGVPAMDGEHQQIIQMINTLHDRLATANSMAAAGELLSQMTRYAQGHFRHEERLLAAHNYPRLLEQRAHHAGYRRKNLVLCRATQQDIAGMPAVLLNFLGHWWTHHILEEDMRYKDFFAGMAGEEIT
jgi:hemerythrin